eukprot:SAG31_NODE_1018_length_10354_cov_10.995514_15_plen_217_part_00
MYAFLVQNGFYFFGWYLTKSTQTATAILASITQLLSVAFPLLGGWLGDKLGRRELVLVLAAIQLLVPVAYLFSAGQFTVIIVTTAFAGVCGGLSGPNLQAIQAECLPVGPDGKSKNAGRDVSLTVLFTFAPSIITPIAGGALFDILGKTVAYNTLLVWWVLCGITGLYFLRMLFVTNEPITVVGLESARYSIGSRLCDGLLFTLPRRWGATQASRE